MKIYSFFSFLTTLTAYLLDGTKEEKQVALYPRLSPVHFSKNLKNFKLPALKSYLRAIPISKPIIEEEAYYNNNVYDEVEEIEHIEV